MLNEVLISKILVFRREGDPSHSFVIVIYLLEAREFFFFVDALDSWFQVEVKIGQLILLCPAFQQQKQRPFSM